MPAADIILAGITRSVDWAQVDGGAALVAVAAVWICLLRRAGIGVTPEHLLVRTGTGRMRVIPWAQVTGFEAVTLEAGSGKTLCVVTSGGRRRHTVGYSAWGLSARRTWHLLRALEDERLARTPGSASMLPPCPSGTGEISPAIPLVLTAASILLVLVGSVSLNSGLTNIGPAIRAADGAGTTGYFIPQVRQCNKGGCYWDGEFRLPDGAVSLQEIGLADVPESALRTGVPVAARDTGDAANVYAPEDPGAWHGAAYSLAMGCWCCAVLLAAAVWPVVCLLRRGRRGGNGAEDT